MARSSAEGKRVFVARVPANVMKDRNLSLAARALYCYLAVCADGSTGITSVTNKGIESNLRIGRARREAAQRELSAAGWATFSQQKDANGRYVRNVIQVFAERQEP